MLNIVYVLYVLNVKAGLIDKSRARGKAGEEFLYAMLFVLAVTKPDVLVLLPWTAPMDSPDGRSAPTLDACGLPLRKLRSSFLAQIFAPGGTIASHRLRR